MLLDGAGLQPSAKGWRIRYAGDKRTLVDGPFAEAKELIAGYTLIQTKTREEALEWARRTRTRLPTVARPRSRCGSSSSSRTSSRTRLLERFRDIGMGARS